MIPRYGEWHAAGVKVIGIHSPETDGERDLARLKRYVAEKKIGWPVVSDGDMAIWDAWKVQAWPTIFVIDRDGKVRGRFVGDDQAPAIRAMLAGMR